MERKQFFSGSSFRLMFGCFLIFLYWSIFNPDGICFWGWCFLAVERVICRRRWKNENDVPIQCAEVPLQMHQGSTNSKYTLKCTLRFKDRIFHLCMNSFLRGWTTQNRRFWYQNVLTQYSGERCFSRETLWSFGHKVMQIYGRSFYWNKKGTFFVLNKKYLRDFLLLMKQGNKMFAQNHISQFKWDLSIAIDEWVSLSLQY